MREHMALPATPHYTGRNPHPHPAALSTHSTSSLFKCKMSARVYPTVACVLVVIGRPHGNRIVNP